MYHSLNLPNETIGFRTHEKVIGTLVDIHVVGKQYVHSHDYYWDGMKRNDKNTFIFQYTLSGEGAVFIEGKTHKVQQGQGFMLEVPGEHIYYLPSHSHHWEFIFLTLRGQAAADCWRYVNRKVGPIINIPIESALIEQVVNVYELAFKKNLIDHYFASSKAYQFVMECYRYFKSFKAKEQMPDTITQAINFINKNYKASFSVQDVATNINLSKYYFIKLFKESMNMTPGQYITKVRLEQAINLLSHTELTVKEIAMQVGYGDDNYFNKAFRKVVGTSPGEFRRSKHLPFDRLIIQ
ncbi:AraC family transcriptional regulator [Evansella cellulosilytica]|uniref:Transcriptional regulator, AraC family n=1 Tax=Evansella cellulosilytica (strain ATCC 21833 / DSM 2522 / FERM P-1141 / JCM 9156 / N-4) TaxID=649639 RepID=E6TUF9_EVAC2|nr:AraC family transcriptional regulator [Evansella cellulosilytica]ADU29715.1 transcriptional regulator, AraC family [Evansella cellulosilytica DSM 2522]